MAALQHVREQGISSSVIKVACIATFSAALLEYMGAWLISVVYEHSNLLECCTSRALRGPWLVAGLLSTLHGPSMTGTESSEADDQQFYICNHSHDPFLCKARHQTDGLLQLTLLLCLTRVKNCGQNGGFPAAYHLSVDTGPRSIDPIYRE